MIIIANGHFTPFVDIDGIQLSNVNRSQGIADARIGSSP
jgi:hypothetical protein